MSTAVRERPILFGGPMVRAILEGRKTQTRRVVKLTQFQPSDTPGYDWTFRCRRGLWQDYRNADFLAECCPHGRAGDRLWVRETWASPEANKASPGRVAYDADAVCGAWLGDGEGGLIFFHHGRIIEASGYRECFPESGDRTFSLGKYSDVRSGSYPSYRYGWRPSIHMPRWASRITLEITGVRVERLRDISGADAVAEGISPTMRNEAPAVERFRVLWDTINGESHPWASNPWVWAITFRRADA